MDESLIRPQVIMQEKLRLYGSVVIKPSPNYIFFVAIILFVFVLGLYFLATVQYTRTESVLGYLIPEKGISHRYPDRLAIIKDVNVEVGQHVKKGDVLMTLSYDTMLPDAVSSSNAMRQNLQKRLQELQVQAYQAEQKYQIEVADLDNKSHSLQIVAETIDGQILLQQQWLDNAQGRMDLMQIAYQKGGLAKVELDLLNGEILSAKINLQSLRKELLTWQREISANKFLQKRYISEHVTSTSQHAEQRLQLEALSLEREVRSGQSIVAFADDVVISLSVKAGEQVSPNRELIVLAPQQTPLYVDLYIPVESVAFVKPGQQVLIRYDSFPFEKYGVHTAKLEKISSFISQPGSQEVQLNLNRPSFLARARLLTQTVQVQGRDVDLLPGMTLKADIRTQTRSLLEWIFEPLFAVRERKTFF